MRSTSVIGMPKSSELIVLSGRNKVHMRN